MNIVDFYNIKNSNFDLTQFFKVMSLEQLEQMQSLLRAEINERTIIQWNGTRQPLTISHSHIYVGDSITSASRSADITIRYDGQTIGNIQSINADILSHNNHTNTVTWDGISNEYSR